MSFSRTTNFSLLNYIIPKVLRSESRSVCCSSVSLINCHRGTIARVTAPNFTRLYPILLVNSDGSTISIRYEKPRKIIKLPLDLSNLSEAERQARLEDRKPKTKVILEEEIEDSFDADRYAHLWKK